MADEYTDIELDEYGDFVVDAGGDCATVANNAALLQDLAHRFITIPGSLPDAGNDADFENEDSPEDYGVGAQRWLHDDLSVESIQGLILRGEAQMKKDSRVSPGLCKVRPIAIEENRAIYRITVTPKGQSEAIGVTIETEG